MNAIHEILIVNNINLHVVTIGNDHKETPVLLLHGFPEYYYSYRYIMPLLAKLRTVIAVDQRGYNESDKPKRVRNYGLKFLMSDIIEIVKQKSPNKKVILVGHDWGGAVSWHIARYYPTYIERLIILNCPPADLLFRAIKMIPRQFLMSYYIFLFQIPFIPEKLFQAGNFAILRKLLKNINFEGKTISKSEIQEYIQCFNRPRGFSGINYYRAAFRDFLSGRLQVPSNLKVKCPTLVLWGIKDFALSIGLTHYFHEYVEKNMLIIKYFDEVGHFIQQEKPKKVAKEILNFI